MSDQDEKYIYFWASSQQRLVFNDVTGLCDQGNLK